MNNWLLSCRWMCPSAGASCVAAGNSSTRSDASLTFRSALTLCHRLSFSGTLVSTRTSSGPFPTSKEKTTSEDAWEQGNCQDNEISDMDKVVIKKQNHKRDDLGDSSVGLSLSYWTLISKLSNLCALLQIPGHFWIIHSSTKRHSPIQAMCVSVLTVYVEFIYFWTFICE